MARPAVSGWESVFGFPDDPTPGDAEVLGELARSYRSVADNAGDALPLVSGLENQQVGEGKSMDKLRDKLGDLANKYASCTAPTTPVRDSSYLPGTT
ncbi:hypothetical protein ACFXPQ_27855 [Streptomyces lydicus]|uniref:hypothetical protein n=1 Tax=Streptomyces lydicus TaxID=47763 RepID=UPI0036A97946